MTKAKTKQTIATAAVIIEPQRELVISQMEPGLDILANFDEIAAYVADLATTHRGFVVTEDYVPQAKRELIGLRRVVKDISDARLNVKRLYMAPVVAFEDRVKELDAPLKEVIDDIGGQVKEYETTAKAEKRAKAVQHYEDYAGALADAVPFERIEDPKWDLKSADIVTVYEAIERRVDKIAEEDAMLDSLNLAHPLDAKAEYFATLDVSKAVARSKAIEDQREAALVLAAQKAEWEERQRKATEERALDAAAKAPEVSAPAPQTAPAPVVPETPQTPHTETAEEVGTYLFTVTCTAAQVSAIGAAIKAMGLSGTVGRR